MSGNRRQTKAPHGNVMSHPPAIFVGDSVGLDFLNSIATPIDTPVDWIADGEGLHAPGG